MKAGLREKGREGRCLGSGRKSEQGDGWKGRWIDRQGGQGPEDLWPRWMSVWALVEGSQHVGWVEEAVCKGSGEAGRSAWASCWLVLLKSQWWLEFQRIASCPLQPCPHGQDTCWEEVHLELP